MFSIIARNCTRSRSHRSGEDAQSAYALERFEPIAAMLDEHKDAQRTLTALSTSQCRGDTAGKA